MWILIGAVVSSSLLGSMHCVGMCGPLAIWASGAGDSRVGSSNGGRSARRQMAAATTLYHVGRLITYAIAGVIAGAAGSLVDYGGEALGVQLFAARMVGATMILMGLFRLVTIFRVATPKALSPKPSMVTRALLRMRPYIFRLPLLTKGLATGLLTAFLPCGWLYLFALVAAGTGSIVMGPIVMIAFWIGTVPALVGLVAGTRLLAGRYVKLIPGVASTLLVVAGGYTAMGRGFAQLNSLSDIQSTSRLTRPSSVDSAAAGKSDLDIAQELKTLVETPLPCCVEESKPAEPTSGGAL
jgi:uncharacterized protein